MVDKEDFIGIFKTETEDHLTNLDKGLVELEKNPNNLGLVKDLNREAHTLKGSARVFGYHEMQDIAHRIEDIFDKVAQKRLVFNSPIADKIFKGLDAIRVILEKIVKNEGIDVDTSDICKDLEECLTKNRRTKNKEQRIKTEAAAEGKIDERQKAEMQKSDRQVEERQKTRDEEQERKHEDVRHPSVQVEEYIRVPLSRVNKLLNLIGEMVINKMKSSQKIVQAKKISRLTKEVQKKVSELGETLKKKFPLEEEGDGKLLSQCNADLQKLKDDSLNLYDIISTEAFHLDPVIDELQAKMKEIRMLPCSTIFEGFPRMVRDIASQKEKEINLEISGEETELDKKVLEGIKVPLIHILRNCIDHGIEKPDKRFALGKSGYGTIKLSAFHEAGNVVMVIEDDGKGIDVEEVKQIALKKHFVSAEELEAMTEKEILNLVFMNSYSTSPIITDVSGRGIGLDIVRRDIENLKGQVVLDSEKGKRTRLTLILPLTIAIIQVLLVKTQDMLFALPMTSVIENLMINMEEISTIEGRMAIQVREHTVPVVRLREVLALPRGQDEEQGTESEVSVVIATSLDKRVGFIVDEITGEEEVFIKSLGEHLGKVKNVSGATILGTGEVVLILDVKDLIAQSALSHPAVSGKEPVPKEKRKEKRILIVEDALSTRELEKSILEAHGYQVDTAVDGLDALDKIPQAKYDLIISDVNMPRMDGFEFCKTLHKHEKYKDIPVAIVTSLDKEEDKRRGIEVGASAYIVKNAFDQTNLLDTIERLIA